MFGKRLRERQAMSMTPNEALERALKIWGADVLCNPVPHAPGEWYVVQSTNGMWHHLDGNGHTVCHEECSRREERAFTRCPEQVREAFDLEAEPRWDDPKYVELQEHLVQVTNELNRLLGALENRLNGLNLGVTAWTKASVGLQYGYDKGETGWGVYVRQARPDGSWTTWPLDNAPRALRAAFPKYVDALLTAMTQEATALTKQIEEAVETVRSWKLDLAERPGDRS
jgi:hypothetical protein